MRHTSRNSRIALGVAACLVQVSRSPAAHLATALTASCVEPLSFSAQVPQGPIAQMRRHSRYSQSAQQQALRAKSRR